MASVSKFILDGTTIDVADATARSEATSAKNSVASLTTRVSNVEKLARLSVSYTEAQETITFTSSTNN